MNNSKGNKQEKNLEIGASLRVGLLNHPVLKSMHRKAIEDFEVAYKDYQERVKSQGSATAKPLLKAMCVSREQREVIALMKSIRFSQLTHDIINQYISDVKQEQHTDVQMDERNIFKGITMRAADDINDIGAAISDFFGEVNNRTRECGLANHFLQDYESKELRKQSFPLLLKGAWPREATQYLKKKWEKDGRKWMLQELLVEIKTCASTFGPYELLKNGGKEWKSDRKETTQSGKSDSSRANWTPYKGRYSSNNNFKKQEKQGEKPTNVSEWNTKKGGGSRAPARAGATDSKRWMSGGGTQKIVCFKCGQPGHRRPECKLADDNYKVIQHQKKYMEAKKGLRKLGVNFMVNEQLVGKKEAEEDNVEEDEEDNVLEQERQERKNDEYSRSEEGYSSDCSSQ